MATSWEVLLTRRISSAIPLSVHISSAETVIEYSLDEYVGFQDIMAASSPARALELLIRLSDMVLESPLVMDRSLRVFCPERLYYHAETEKWHVLLLPTEGEDRDFLVLQPGHTLLRYNPCDLWKELLDAAAGVNEMVVPHLAEAVSYVQQTPFKVHDLRGRLEMGLEALMAIEMPLGQEPAAETVRTGENVPEEEATASVEKPEEVETGEAISGADSEEERENVPEVSVPIPDTQEFPLSVTAMSIPEEQAEEPLTEPDGSVETPAAEKSTSPEPAIEPRPWEKGAAYRKQAEETGVPVKPAPGPEKEVAGKKIYGETVVLGYDSVPEKEKKKTDVLVVPVEQIRIPRVIRKRTKEMAYVDRAEMIIGAKPGSVDFLIRDNWTISRKHASIVTRGGKYFLVDLGATNGVIYKGKKIPKKTEIPIEVGDVFTLSNEDFSLEW